MPAFTALHGAAAAPAGVAAAAFSPNIDVIATAAQDGHVVMTVRRACGQEAPRTLQRMGSEDIAFRGGVLPSVGRTAAFPL
jgi:hypothetical protein